MIRPFGNVLNPLQPGSDLAGKEKVKTSRTIRVTAYLLGLAGAALFTGLIVHQGAAEVGTAVAGAGWGLVAIVGLHLVKLLSDTAGWLILLPKHDRPPLHTALWMHWVGESVSNLLPAARVGGDISNGAARSNAGRSLDHGHGQCARGSNLLRFYKDRLLGDRFNAPSRGDQPHRSGFRCAYDAVGRNFGGWRFLCRAAPGNFPMGCISRLPSRKIWELAITRA